MGQGTAPPAATPLPAAAPALAATPPMGWNSWNMFGSRIHDEAIRETADALASSGLRDCGYDYAVIDDCWSKKDGRDANGDLAADPDKFPGGIYGGPGGWNDLDMLVVGLKGRGHVSGGGLSFLEYQTHMSPWCMACSPLMIGCDVRSMDAETAGPLMNREVLAVSQDPLGVPARRVKRLGACEVWRKPLSDGSVAVALINRGPAGGDVSVQPKDVGLLDAPKRAYDLWAGADRAEFGWEMTQRVEPHQTVLLKVTPR